MTTLTLVLVHSDPTMLAQLEQSLLAHGYTTITQQWHDDVQATITRSQPTAVILGLPGDCTPEDEWAFIESFHSNPELAAVPVLLCADRAVLLEGAVRALQQRNGAVIASSGDIDEVLAKLSTIQRKS